MLLALEILLLLYPFPLLRELLALWDHRDQLGILDSQL